MTVNTMANAQFSNILMDSDYASTGWNVLLVSIGINVMGDRAFLVQVILDQGFHTKEPKSVYL